MKRLYFIRHGHSEAQDKDYFSGTLDVSLTDHGRKQAQKAGKAAKKLKIDLIVSSPMQRAAETSRIIAKEIGYPKNKILTNKVLVERDFGELEGKKWIPPREIDLTTVKNAEHDELLIKIAKRAYK